MFALKIAIILSKYAKFLKFTFDFFQCIIVTTQVLAYKYFLILLFMLIKSQLLFIFKILIVSAIVSFFIKYCLDNWLIIDHQIYLALTIILSPVLSLLIILLIKQKIFL